MNQIHEQEEETQMRHKPQQQRKKNGREREKKLSTVLGIRQRRFKITVKYHSTLTGLENIFKLVNIKQPCGKTVCHFIVKENIYFHESATPSEALKHMYQETRMFTTPLSQTAKCPSTIE